MILEPICLLWPSQQGCSSLCWKDCPHLLINVPYSQYLVNTITLPLIPSWHYSLSSPDLGKLSSSLDIKSASLLLPPCQPTTLAHRYNSSPPSNIVQTPYLMPCPRPIYQMIELPRCTSSWAMLEEEIYTLISNNHHEYLVQPTWKITWNYKQHRESEHKCKR